MIAHNNSEIDYFRIACANALMIRKNLNVPVTLITDEGSYNWGKESLGQEFLDSNFDSIIKTQRDWNFKNPRVYSDTKYTTKTLEFYNCSHWKIFDLSPYDETLFIDADYLIMSNALSACWDSPHDMLIDNRIYSNYGSIETRLIDDFGIKLFWATVIYFKKTEFTRHLFNLVSHIEENYQYYRDLYSLRSGMFRNDNAFSIAVHTMQGFSLNLDGDIGRLPIPALFMCWDTSDVIDIPEENQIVLLDEYDNKNRLVKMKNTDVHIMNKWAINRVSKRLLEIYGQ